ncbi:MAG TPA: glycosyltransferase [Thermoleophilaceae bacterium]|nr:glycosyltransferase [Thermoleophilaceae bacterium]
MTADSRPEVSVVIPTYNAEPHLGALLDSLAAQTWDGAWEVVVADNGSSDRTLEVAESYRDRVPGLRIVDASDRAGVSHARNAGVAAAAGSSLVFIDNDDLAGEGYVAAMAAGLREQEFVCARWDVDRLNPYWTRALRPSGQSEGPMTYNYDFLPYAAGGTLGITRRTFDAVGGFDESIVYGGCVDLCWKVQLDAGEKLGFVPDAVIHYRYRGNLRGIFSQARSWGMDEVALYSRWRGRGLQRIPLRRSLRRWKFVIHLRRLRRAEGRAWWATELGNHLGRIHGSLKYRSLML